MKSAMPSLSQKSDHERIPTSTPHHWCASSCDINKTLSFCSRFGRKLGGIRASPPASCPVGSGIEACVYWLSPRSTPALLRRNAKASAVFVNATLCASVSGEYRISCPSKERFSLATPKLNRYV